MPGRKYHAGSLVREWQYKPVAIDSREIVSSGGLAVKHATLGANGRRFEPR